MRALRPAGLLAGLLVAVALSGCLGASDEPDTSAPAASPAPALQPRTSPPVPTTTAPAPNMPPTLNISVTYPFGTTPSLNVSFELTGQDPDGDNFTWTLDADGDGNPDATGDLLPATIDYTYDTDGNYTAVATIDDGEETVNAEASVDLAPLPPPGPPTPIIINGTITGAFIMIDYAGDPVDHPFDLAVPVSNITITVVGHVTAPDIDFIVFAPDGTVAAMRQNENEPTGNVWPAQEAPVSITEESLVLQTGAWKIRILAAIAIAGEYTITITFA